MSLMASEAVVDSRDFEILTAEEVDELKKEQQVLTSRLGAMGKKLSLETKIRDAALSLSKVNASHKKVSKQTEEQLDAANRRVESAQKEYWRVSDRANEINKKLLEHRAGVLSFSVRNMEKKMFPSHTSEDSGYDSSNRSTLMSPTTSSMTGVSTSSQARFDGAHLFAGHADAVIPRRKLSPEAAATEISSLEEKLKAVTESLTAAGKKQAEMARELSLLQLEKQEVETMMGLELQNAEDTISALEKELPRLEGLDFEVQQLLEEKRVWEEERAQLQELETGERLAPGAEKMLEEIRKSNRQQLEEKDAEIQELRAIWEAERKAWDQERTRLEKEKEEDLKKMHSEMDHLREDDEDILHQANEELEASREALRSMVAYHGIVLFSRDPSLQGLLESIGTHLEGIHKKLEAHSRVEAEWELSRRRLEDDIRSGFDKRELLAREVEDARRERDSAKRETASLESRVKADLAMLRSPPTPASAFPSDSAGDTDVGMVIAAILPVWQILPSPEARAAKFSGNGQRSYRTGSPTPGTPGGTNGNGVITSLSDLDVRSLKSLYDSRQTPGSPKVGGGTFTVEAFVARVLALIADDRALIERLIRFAQAHDLLKKNAERAQKLAQDGNTALETYQKQVRILEERNMSMAARQAAMQEELQILHDTIERIAAEKRDVEMLAAEQAEECRQLTAANNTLSARTLTLAEEAASAPEMVRKQLEAQLSECRKALELAQDEVDAMRSSEQSQRIALLDELNSMQTENGNLRAQLRAVKK